MQPWQYWIQQWKVNLVIEVSLVSRLNQLLRNIIPDTVNGALLLHKVLANIKDIKSMPVHSQELYQKKVRSLNIATTQFFDILTF